jgi:phosphoglycolate phosphatase
VKVPRTPEALDRFLAHYDLRLTACTRPYPGIPEALDALRAAGCVLAVLTNKPQRATDRILASLDLEPKFSDVVGGDTPVGRKPDPAGLLGIIERAGAARASTILVGDSRIDLATARKAGTRICLARYGFGFRSDTIAFHGDEIFVDDPSQLPGIIGLPAPESQDERNTSSNAPRQPPAHNSQPKSSVASSDDGSEL